MEQQKPVIALMYDFDKTLCTKNMQEYSFIPNVNMTCEQFWDMATELAQKHKMDSILAYMYLMLECSHTAHKPINREAFVAAGQKLTLYPGVEDWFARINQIGIQEGVHIEHYIISSGLREIIEGSVIYKQFREVFACEFLYNENNVACWPKNVVNYTTKTQFLFRINKGVLDLCDNETLNQYVTEEERPVPFRNMIYIGDGLTDVPCMRLVKANGGYAIAVYPEGGDHGMVDKLQTDGRVNFTSPANYTADSTLERLVHTILRKMAVQDALIATSRSQLTK